jgi:general secretion pathway protein K
MKAKQRGVAIVLAMGVVALAAMTATAIMVSQVTWARQSELTTDHAQAHSLVRVGVDWARAVLAQDRVMSNVDHLGEPWALKIPPIPIDKGEITGFIVDQQSAFNLNNVVTGGRINPEELARFRRLLSILGLPATLAEALADWIDADNVPQLAGGAEDDYYLALEPPYLAANQPLADVSELALIRGFDDAVRARLKPFVTALPQATPINVNTASPEVLAAVVDGMDLDAARAIVAQRDRAYFTTITDFSSRLPGRYTPPLANIAVASAFFTVTLRVTFGQTQAHGAALLTREGAGWPAVVWQKYL